MYKKYLSIFLILVAALAFTSACSPAEADTATEEPYVEEIVTDEPNTGTNVTDVTDETTPACLLTVETMLNDDEDPQGSDELPQLDEEYILVTYLVNGDEISSPTVESGVPEELVSYQEDTATQEYLWQFVTDVIPTAQREILGEFIIFSDGYSNVVGAVDEGDSPGTWTLEMDIIDSQDMATLSTTLIHELGHMLTLNDQQINDQSSCENYMSIDGCSESDSYINAFYNAFWVDIYDEWSSTVEFADGEVNEDQVLVFYDEYPDDFVSDYAPTGPEEDIAESWLYFVFSTLPAGDTIAEQKILFFYDYPELVELRQSILNGLCQYTSQ